MMEGIYAEQAQIRCRQLQDQVSALNQQIRALKDENLRHRQAELDRAKEVQELHAQLRKERDRIQRMAIELANWRRKEEVSKNCHDHVQQNCCNIANEGLQRYLQVIPVRRARMKRSLIKQPIVSKGEHERLSSHTSVEAAKINDLTSEHCSLRTSDNTHLCKCLDVANNILLKEFLPQLGIVHSKECRDLISNRLCRAIQKLKSTKKDAATLEDSCFRDNEKHCVPYCAITGNLLRIIDGLEIENTRLRKSLVHEKERDSMGLENYLKNVRGSSSIQVITNGSQELKWDNSEAYANPINFLGAVREVENSIIENPAAIKDLKCNWKASEAGLNQTILVDRQLGSIICVDKYGQQPCGSRQSLEHEVMSLLSFLHQFEKIPEQLQGNHCLSELVVLTRKISSLTEEKQRNSKLSVEFPKNVQMRKMRFIQPSNQIKDLEAIIAGLKAELEELRSFNAGLILSLEEAKIVISNKDQGKQVK
eukprot:c23875_g1_i1 orf=113-1552(+)